MACRNGCSLCCTSISVRRIEYACIADELTEAGYFEKPGDVRNDANDPPNRCAFLENGSCSIYPLRPIICRLHGLALSYPVTTPGEIEPAEPGENSDERVVTWCDLNFTDRHPDRGPQFTADAFVDIGWFEQRLAELDRRFAEQTPSSPPAQPQLIRVDFNPLYTTLFQPRDR